MIRRIVIFLILILALVLAYRHCWPHRAIAEDAYIGDRQVTLWSSTAPVRQPLASLSYGERVRVLGHFGENAEVRTPEGLTGWVREEQLVSAERWQRVKELADQAQAMVVQGRGHTRVPSNVRLEPGRTGPRIFQFRPNIPVEVLARVVAERPHAGEQGQASEEPSTVQKEDWLLVRGRSPEFGEVTGWVLGRFVDYDLPEPLPEYASAADMHVMAWLELDRVKDPQLGPKPQYLLAGTKGPEGQACDFRMLRVFTWSTKRKRYETAYIESNLCGRLPINVSHSPNGDVFFRFSAIRSSGEQELNYRMRQTIVRRLRPGGQTASRPR